MPGEAAQKVKIQEKVHNINIKKNCKTDRKRTLQK